MPRSVSDVGKVSGLGKKLDDNSSRNSLEPEGKASSPSASEGRCCMG